MIKLSEKEIQDQIIQVLSRKCKIYRMNAGTVKKGRYWIKLAPKGFPDLFGFRKSDGKMFFIEVKDHKGKLSKEQIEFEEEIKQYNVIYGVARSVEDALKIIEV